MTPIAFGPNLQEHLLALKSEGAQARILEAYSLSLNAQPDFQTVIHQKQVNDLVLEANAHMGTARKHGTHYLNVVQPSIIKTLGDMDHYFNTQLKFSQAMTSDKSNAEVGRIFDALAARLDEYKEAASGVETLLQGVRADFNADQRVFGHVQAKAIALHKQQEALLNVHRNRLEEVERELKAMHQKCLLGILGLIGGAVVVVVGSVVTAGAAAPALVTGGIGMIGTGVAGIAKGASGYKGLMSEKRELILQIQRTDEGIGVLSGMSSSLGSFGDSAKLAVEAAQTMVNSWTFLSDSLADLSKDLKSDRQYIDILRSELIELAQSGLNTVSTDLKTVRDQMRGTGNVVNAKVGETIDQAVERVHLEQAGS